LVTQSTTPQKVGIKNYVVLNVDLNVSSERTLPALMADSGAA